MALNATFVKQAKHTGKPSGDKHADGGGMYLLVTATGNTGAWITALLASPRPWHWAATLPSAWPVNGQLCRLPLLSRRRMRQKNRS